VRVLRVPGFALLLAGQAVNATGSWVSVIAIWGFAAFKYDVGAGEIALLFVVLSVPGALLGPLLGVPIDRFGPRATLVVANVLGVVDALALTRADSYHQIILLALPLGLIEALALASLDAIPPRIVPDDQLVRANALLGGAQDLALVLGPVAAAVVNSHWGISGAFYVDAATWLVGAVVAMRMRVGHVHRERERVESTAWQELREGGRVARRSAGLRWTLGVAASVYALWALFGVLEPLYVRDVLGEGDAVFALLQTVFGIGLVATGLVLAVWGDRLVRPVIVAVAVIASGITAALYLGTSSIVVAFVGVFLWGVDVAFFYVPVRTLLQRYAPLEFHGRVMSLNHSIEPAAGIVVTPLAALALTVVGVQALGVAGGLAAMVGGVFVLRHALRLGPPPPAGPVDEAALSTRDAIALGGAAPG
jgi:DHA3 family macrolide efflux protein-like MFS transporter